MWLLNARSRELEYYEGDRIPKYAILSHRWEDEEVTFEDIRLGQGMQKKGYRKIELSCAQALRDPTLKHEVVHHVWVDTCCINKDSSAELSEAINSMFAWYRNAVVCYAYLADVERAEAKHFEKSAWFTRGWTLQELLAPEILRFYDTNWDFLGDRSDLSAVICDITGIDRSALLSGLRDPSTYPVLRRLKWAAGRQTTRLEDQAYSLLGLFQVNMPLIYGEGPRAFRRLQEEILKGSDDITIFAWQYEEESFSSSIFPTSPFHFLHPDKTLTTLEGVVPRCLLSSDAVFISATVQLHPIAVTSDEAVYVVPLCTSSHKVAGMRNVLGMVLSRKRVRDTFKRCVDMPWFGTNRGQALFEIYEAHRRNEAQMRSILIHKRALRYLTPINRSPIHSEGRSYGFRLDAISGVLPEHKITSMSNASDSSDKHLGLYPGNVGIAGIVRIAQSSNRQLFFHFGFDFDFNIFCLVSRCFVDGKSEGWKPAISVPRLGIKDVALLSEYDTMQVISMLQSQGNSSCSMRDDNIEIHFMSHRNESACFYIRDIGTVNVDATTTEWIRLRIALGNYLPVITGSGEEDVWHEATWK